MHHVAVLALLAGAMWPTALPAATKVGPTWSEVTGHAYSRAKMNRAGAVIKAIDDHHTRDRVVKVAPGEHVIRVQSPTRKGIAGSDQDVHLTLEPCKRYYINAQFASSVGADWEPVVDFVEPLTGCKVP